MQAALEGHVKAHTAIPRGTPQLLQILTASLIPLNMFSGYQRLSQADETLQIALIKYHKEDPWAFLMSNPAPELGAHLSKGSARGALQYLHIPAVEDNVKPQSRTISKGIHPCKPMSKQHFARITVEDSSRCFSSYSCRNTLCRHERGGAWLPPPRLGAHHL